MFGNKTWTPSRNVKTKLLKLKCPAQGLTITCYSRCSWRASDFPVIDSEKKKERKNEDQQLGHQKIATDI